MIKKILALSIVLVFSFAKAEESKRNLMTEASSFEVGIDNGLSCVPYRPYSVSLKESGSGNR